MNHQIDSLQNAWGPAQCSQKCGFLTFEPGRSSRCSDSFGVSAPEETKEIEMPIFNVTVTMETTLVVIADDEGHAWDVARDNARTASSDAFETPQIHVTGEVRSVESLPAGWDGECVPYGGDGNTRLQEILAPSAY